MLRVDFDEKRLADLIAERVRIAQPVTKRLYTKAEAAEYLGRSKRSIDSLVSGGALRRVRGDGHPMFDIKELDEYIERVKEA